MRDWGVIIDCRDAGGKTPLAYAASHGHSNCVRVMVQELGARLGVFDNSGCTPLHHAVRNGFCEVAHLLVWELGADVNAASESDFSPLHAAAMGATVKSFERWCLILGWQPTVAMSTEELLWHMLPGKVTMNVRGCWHS